MFNPSRDEVRQFFLSAWQDLKAGLPLEGSRRVAADIIARHPEYQALLSSGPAALEQHYRPEDGRPNPFLHLSLHLAVEEQLSIDQPPGIRDCYLRLLRHHNNDHDAQHDVLECLGEILWRSQREGAPPDAMAYLALLRRRAGGGEDPEK